MHTARSTFTFIASLVFATSAAAQISFPEAEPNSVRTESTAVNGIVAGDSITGTSSGTDATAGSAIVTTVDLFRVKTAALPAGLYAHRLTITSATTGHVGTIRGLTQTGTACAGGAVGGTDLGAQFSVTSPIYNLWYGFGAQEEIYYRVEGSGATPQPYAAVMSTTPVSPTVIAPAFDSNGPITISTVGLTFTDTEIVLFDSLGNLVGQNDHECPQATGQSKLVRTLTPGTYYLGVSTYELCVDQPAPVDDAFFGVLIDFPNAVVLSSSSTFSQDWDFEIRACNGQISQVNQSPSNSPFVVTWYQFTASPGAPPITAPTNDACASAAVLTSPAILTVSMGAATNDGSATCDPGGAASKDLWYSFTNPLPGPSQLRVNTCGGTSDTVLTLYSGCGGAELACSDDCGGTPCSGPSSCLSTTLAASQTVTLRVSDKGLGGCSIELTLRNGPLNDDCSSPTNISGFGNFPINSLGATTGTEGQTETSCLFLGSTTIAQDVWYTWVASANGTVELTTCGGIAGGPSPDSKIAVYTGAGCPVAGTAIACNEDSLTMCSSHPFNARVFFNAVCGNSYTFQMGMYPFTTATMSGTFSVTLTTPGGTCTPTTPFCDGSSVGTTCLGCGTNNGLPGRGCGNSSFAAGALLSSTGNAGASLATDTFVLTASDVTGPGLFFQANGLFGSPATFGDGMLCAGSGIIRMGVVFPTAGSASYPGGTTPNPIHIAGGPISSGDTRHYQCWYRDAIAFCTSATFNLTQGLSLTWGP